MALRSCQFVATRARPPLAAARSRRAAARTRPAPARAAPPGCSAAPAGGGRARAAASVSPIGLAGAGRHHPRTPGCRNQPHDPRHAPACPSLAAAARAGLGRADSRRAAQHPLSPGRPPLARVWTRGGREIALFPLPPFTQRACELLRWWCDAWGLHRTLRRRRVVLAPRSRSRAPSASLVARPRARVLRMPSRPRLRAG